MRTADALTVSTPELAVIYSDMNPNIYVLRNQLDLELRAWSLTEARLPEEQGKIVVGWAGGSCYSPDTEVLTRRGFKRFTDVLPDDELATLSLDSGTLEYQKPVHLVVSIATKHLYEAEDEAASFAVTPNHWMVVVDGGGLDTIQMEELEGKSFSVVKGASNWVGSKLKSIDLAGIRLASRDWVDILAVWAASDSSGHARACKDPLTAHKALKHLSGLVNVSLSTGAVEVQDPGLKRFLSTLKGLPLELKNLVTEHLRRFLDIYLRAKGIARGYSDRDGDVDLLVESMELADDLCELALKTGGAGDLLGVAENGVVSLRLYLPRSDKLVRTLRPKQVRKAAYVGPVYCAVVPNHTLYVRRNGKAFWCGNTHQDDFGVIGGALRAVLLENPDTVFSICTSKDLAQHAVDVLDLPPERVVFIPPVPFEKYPPRLSHFDIGLAPLLKSRFNNAKSELRCLEYGAYGVPCVASRLASYRAWINEGVDGFTAASEAEWYEALTALVRDPELRRRVGEESRRRVYAERNMADHVDEWLDAYLEVLSQPKRSEPVGAKPKQIKIGRNDPCPLHPEYKLKKCPYGCCDIYA